jgi:Zn-dependent protease/CBS domain-containing protein
MNGNIRLGKALGIPIELNPSWFLIFFLVVWSLGAQVFPAWQPGLGATAYWAMGLLTALVLFGSLLFHEMAHSLMSRRFGVEVKRITLFLFGGVSESPEEMPSARAEFWIAIVGPLSSFALALGFFGLSYASRGLGGPEALSAALGWLGVVNTALAVFNLVPGFPLDGGRVVRAAVWARTGDLRRATRWASYGGQAFATILMGVGIARLLGGNWFGGLWMAFLGWLLFQAAQGSYTQVKVKQALNRVRVAELMSPEVVTLPPGATLREAVEQAFMRLAYGGYPVVDEAGRLLGMVTRAQVKAVPADRWDVVTVAEAMVPVDRLPVVTPDEPAGDRLETLMGEGLGRLPVVEDGRVVGVLSQTDLIRYLTWHEEGGTGRYYG